MHSTHLAMWINPSKLTSLLSLSSAPMRRFTSTLDLGVMLNESWISTGETLNFSKYTLWLAELLALLFPALPLLLLLGVEPVVLPSVTRSSLLVFMFMFMFMFVIVFKCMLLGRCWLSNCRLSLASTADIAALITNTLLLLLLLLLVMLI